jgi:hypothetical protein
VCGAPFVKATHGTKEHTSKKDRFSEPKGGCMMHREHWPSLQLKQRRLEVSDINTNTSFLGLSIQHKIYIEL